MAFKDVLVVLRGFPTPTPPSAVDDAVELAALLGARLSGVACVTTPRIPRSILGNALIDVSGLVAAESHKIAVGAQAVLTVFQDAAAKRGVLGQHILHKCQPSESRARSRTMPNFATYAILPMPEGDYLQQLDSNGTPKRSFSIRSPDHHPAVRPQAAVRSRSTPLSWPGTTAEPRPELSPMPFPYSDRRRSRAW